MTDIGRPHMPTFGTGVPRSALRVPGVPLNITDGKHFFIFLYNKKIYNLILYI